MIEFYCFNPTSQPEAHFFLKMYALILMIRLFNWHISLLLSLSPTVRSDVKGHKCHWWVLRVSCVLNGLHDFSGALDQPDHLLEQLLWWGHIVSLAH